MSIPCIKGSSRVKKNMLETAESVFAPSDLQENHIVSQVVFCVLPANLLKFSKYHIHSGSGKHVKVKNYMKKSPLNLQTPAKT